MLYYVKIIISHGERVPISQFLQLDSITGTRPIMVIIDFDNPRRLNLGNLCELSGIKWDGKSWGENRKRANASNSGSL